jgi:hypothetical protein
VAPLEAVRAALPKHSERVELDVGEQAAERYWQLALGVAA